MTEERKNEIWSMLDADFKSEVYSLYEKEHKRFSGQCLANQLEYLFGRQNLTFQAENEPKEPSEPIYNIGDKVRINCQNANGEVWDSVMHNRIATIKDHYVNNGVNMYVLEENYRDFGEHCLKPYNEPKEEEIRKERVKSEKFPIDYAQYRLDLAKEIAVAVIRSDRWDFKSCNPVEQANEIVKRLKETDNAD